MIKASSFGIGFDISVDPEVFLNGDLCRKLTVISGCRERVFLNKVRSVYDFKSVWGNKGFHEGKRIKVS